MSKLNEDTNQLVEVERNKWPALRDLYQSDWPEHFLGFLTVDTFIRWTEKQPNIKNLCIYSLNGDWSDGTFVCVVSCLFVLIFITFCLHFVLLFSIDINYLLIQ